MRNQTSFRFFVFFVMIATLFGGCTSRIQPTNQDGSVNNTCDTVDCSCGGDSDPCLVFGEELCYLFTPATPMDAFAIVSDSCLECSEPCEDYFTDQSKDCIEDACGDGSLGVIASCRRECIGSCLPIRPNGEDWGALERPLCPIGGLPCYASCCMQSLDAECAAKVVSPDGVCADDDSKCVEDRCLDEESLYDCVNDCHFPCLDDCEVSTQCIDSANNACVTACHQACTQSGRGNCLGSCIGLCDMAAFLPCAVQVHRSEECRACVDGRDNCFWGDKERADMLERGPSHLAPGCIAIDGYGTVCTQ